jgi:hypothetical protein
MLELTDDHGRGENGVDEIGSADVRGADGLTVEAEVWWRSADAGDSLWAI